MSESSPIEALDAFAASGIGGMRWKKILSSKAKVFLCENDKETFQRLVRTYFYDLTRDSVSIQNLFSKDTNHATISHYH